jgi:integrase
MTAFDSGRSGRVPSYRRQREKGRPDRAIVTIDGKRHVLGRYGSEESRRRYAELLAALEAATADDPPRAPAHVAPTVAQLMVAYLAHCAEYYRLPTGQPRREYFIIRDALKFVRAEAAPLIAEQFGPKLLKQVRDKMVAADLSRCYVNKQVARVVRMFKWAVSEELIPAATYQSLRTVEGLKRGRSRAKDAGPVHSVPVEVVEATLPHLPPLVADMVRLQLLTGMRSGELVQLRPCDVDRSGEVWWYTPPDHKTAHLGKRRSVAIGPQAQAVLRKYLARGADMACFRPCDSEAKRQAARAAARTTPLSCGNRPGTHRVDEPSRCAGQQYTTASYRRAIARAAKKAGVPDWHPHQLRHTAATVARREFSLDHVQAVLGHSHAAITEVYAELDRAKAAAVARRLG